MLEIIDETLIGFDKKTATILVLLDMSAAFDTVDVSKLISILEHKIRLKSTVLKWFKSFLLGRQQKVLIQCHFRSYFHTVWCAPGLRSGARPF